MVLNRPPSLIGAALPLVFPRIISSSDEPTSCHLLISTRGLE